MKLLKPAAIALIGALGFVGAMAIADAQTQSSPAPAQPQAAAPQPPAGGPGWGGPGAGYGMGPGMMDRGPGWGMGHGWGHHFSKEDRIAFFDARIASIHAGLTLTQDQEKLWAPVEAAAKDMVKSMTEAAEKARAAGWPKDPIDGMKRKADWLIARGEAMKKLADAAAPLYASLTPDQKSRLPMLTHPGFRERVGHWMREHGWGQRRGGWDDDHD